MFHKNELRSQQQKKKRGEVRVFEKVPFEMVGLKSCKVDERTTIFIKKNESCPLQRKRFIETHDIYEFLYNVTGMGGRSKKQNHE